MHLLISRALYCLLVTIKFFLRTLFLSIGKLVQMRARILGCSVYSENSLGKFDLNLKTLTIVTVFAASQILLIGS